MKYLLLLFLITIGINWPEFPYNARLADVLFIPLAASVFAAALRTSALRTSALRTSALRTLHSALSWPDLFVA
ncbi:MAG TPA: hypothetical protein VM096_17900, partial [Vicinamibacterales bacterium]|nr:hypothetical protein [Vicinamibacterales bacterium]